MKKLRILIILLIPLLLITGCGNNSKLGKVVSKTSITKKGLTSYRCKVSITNKDEHINYVVLNEKNKNYDVSITTKDNIYSYQLENGKLIASPGIIADTNKDYTNTDKFLNGLEKATDIKESKEKIDKTEYTKYEFKVSKGSINKMISSFDIKVKKDGKGYVYVDKDNRVYIVNYESGDVSINASYTRYNNVK